MLTMTGDPQASTRSRDYVKRDGSPISQKEGGPKPIVRRHMTTEEAKQFLQEQQVEFRPRRTNALSFEEMQQKARDIMKSKAEYKETIIFDCNEDLEGEAETESSAGMAEGFMDETMKNLSPEELENRIEREWQQNKVEEPPATDAPPNWLSRK
jgi:hypothetical protein